ncbi:type II CAAX prenyl endopeptidase Rce1 family protein [Nocardiopsis composta]|uniref:Membrane protease YdiL (CAAX protease family) n=1 Tax=Nocardiopsis composta TaxID=157465 RepID=A0A7W8QLP2_9ACTN|nr:CPBP family glutamic-type intramembrane protease [Nocardiopsis composta]MBB5432752.1 membrane protease YdiL (CAAX protease family) [Nocardiopsis composta]
MPWSESIPQFSLVATILGVALLLYAAIGEPLLGRTAYRRVDRRRDEDPRALVRFYLLTMGVQWAWAAVAVAILLLSPELSAGDLGLRAPSAFGPLIAAVLGFALALLVIWLLTRDGRKRSSARRVPTLAPSYEPGGATISRLAPRSRTERRTALGLAVTAGLCEELIYRGLFTALGVSLGLPLWAAAVLSCLLFALAHLYQGWWGLVGPGLLGALLMVLYLGTGSLLFPVLLHIAIEARSLLLTGRGRRHAGRGRRARGGRRGGDPEQDAEYDADRDLPGQDEQGEHAEYDDHREPAGYDGYPERPPGPEGHHRPGEPRGAEPAGRRPSDTAPEGIPVPGGAPTQAFPPPPPGPPPGYRPQQGPPPGHRPPQGPPPEYRLPQGRPPQGPPGPSGPPPGGFPPPPGRHGGRPGPQDGPPR